MQTSHHLQTMPINYNLTQMIEENILDNVNFLSEINQNMSDTDFNKEPLVKFTEDDIKFMLRLKEKIENGG